MTDSVTRPSIRQLVLKVHSRCDLACDHCYVYEHVDQSWRKRPTVISDETVARVARRFGEYVRRTKSESVTVILHGGEPLLVGLDRMRGICDRLTRELTPLTTLDLRIHTNGVRLNLNYLEIFAEFGVRVGISLDGDRAANDRHRLDRKGRSSFDRVLKAVSLLNEPAYRHLFSGLLCTVDVDNDPVTVHDALTGLDPPRIDYLLPHSTWDSPPPAGSSGSPTPYADWLLAVFDRWEQQGRRVPVRTFDSVLSTLRGGPSLTEALGLAPSDLAVVETDGSFEQSDALKSAFEGAPATGFDVARHGFEDFAAHPGVRARQSGVLGLSDTCRACPVVESCGGGLYAHRYSGERGFDNPSVFCADLRALVDGIAHRVTERTLAPAVRGTSQLRFSQVELNRTLLAVANQRLAGHAEWEAGWRLFLDLEDGPGADQLNAVLAHPYLRRLLLHVQDPPAGPAHLLTAAVAAAARAGRAASLSWAHPGAALYLPTLGTFALARPCRVTVRTTTDGSLCVSDGDSDPVEVLPGIPSVRWHPLAVSALGEELPLLVDDADPYRDCYGAAVSAPLDAAESTAFLGLLRRAGSMTDSTVLNRVTALPATTVTPLAAGGGLVAPAQAPGALGVAVDVTPGELVRALPLLTHRARLSALRAVADLNLRGGRSGHLLEQANEALGEALSRPDESSGRSAALDRAARALALLRTSGDHGLTETGAALVEQLWLECAKNA